MFDVKDNARGTGERCGCLRPRPMWVVLISIEGSDRSVVCEGCLRPCIKVLTDS
jgi:hypothetical protein